MTAWSAVLPDRIVGGKAEGGKITVLTHARTLTEVEAGGKVGAQRVLDETNYQSAVKDMQTLPGPRDREARQKKLDPQRLVKLVAVNGKRTAVAFWGGVVQVLDEQGRLQAMSRLPQDIMALMWSNGRLITGDADGRLTALTVK